MSRLIDPFAVDRALRRDLAEALIAQGRFSDLNLNGWLRSRLSGTDFDAGALLTDPVVEAAAEYLSSGSTPDELGDLLAFETRKALVGEPGDDHRFTYPAFAHQIKSWKSLSHDQRKSLLVASGTGSGKTECFMVPMLDDLVRESMANNGAPLTGVRALMLYPLNALIASQKDRLDRWTRPFDGRLRYGLYNGLMQNGRAEDIRKARAEAPQETRYRNDLYDNPPPILVTNNTMLEYMTIRRQDRPILDASAGKLRWIIVDEAHSYIGSSAAELSLLLRRVLQAFEVQAEDVRFVATSATIGSEDEAGQRILQEFWADVAGIDVKNVDVVFGKREPLSFPEKESPAAQSIVEGLSKISPERRYDVAKKLAEELREKSMPLAEVHRRTGGDGSPLLHRFAGLNADGPLLPMRVHKFIRAVPGLWSCINRDCPGDHPENWPFGALFFERKAGCSHCQSLVFEVQGCSACGEAMLLAEERGGVIRAAIERRAANEFADEVSLDDATDEGEGNPERVVRGFEIMIAGRPVEGARQHGFDCQTGELSDRSDSAGIWVAQSAEAPCPVCSNSGTADHAPYSSWRFGMPFLAQNAVPLVIDGVNPMPVPHPHPLPNDGRQVISFTDSRQGTARTAARIETQSERNFVRAFVYHAVQQAGETPKGGPARSDLEAQLKQMEDAGLTSGIAWEMIRKQLDEASREPTGSLSWQTMVDHLASSPILEHTIRQVWNHERGLQLIDQPSRLANFLLLRELGRRPVNANTIETMGLARLTFPVIENLQESALPSAFRNSGKTLQDWQDFLYFMVDQLRTAFALRMNREEEHWLPGSAFAKRIVGPQQEKQYKSDYSWPMAKGHGNEPNAVKAIALGLELDPVDPGDRHAINETLTAAWNALRPILSAGDSYALDLANSQIEQIHTAWRCPVSRRLVPRLVFSQSPNTIAFSNCTNDINPVSVRMPVLPRAFPSSNIEMEALRTFGDTNEQIESLRLDGLWTAIHDRMLINAPFVRAEEHSAQQPAWRLREFEAQFKKGEINMLACSTTMEMGVDIGSIEAVVNTNVPPSIANYRQRVGRAGRRRQGYAFSLTIARDTPLDRETLNDPAAYLARTLRAPKITLDSRPITQRHVNALLLAAWLAESGGQLTRIEAGDFFGCRPDLAPLPADQHSPCSEFIEWLSLPATRSKMQQKLDNLVRGTILQGDTQLLATCAEGFSSEASKFVAVWDRFREQIGQVANEAQGYIKHQATRVCREYLLKELANRALIPGSGFPTSVVPFVNDCRFSKSLNDRDPATDQGARGRRYDYPSRNADIAIREYAPGANVVVDGLVWQSAGVALTWKRPVDDADARETQSFKRLWFCAKCGAHGTGYEMTTRCSSCGAGIAGDIEYLEPSGFRVDWGAVPNADTDRAEYIEPEEPLVSASESDWQPLLDPKLGRFRTSPVGTVFHYSSGPGKTRYDLCLDCGRASPHREDSDALQEHEALTPMKGQAGRCSGNDRGFAIKRGIALGFEVQTDVAELQLCDLDAEGPALALGSAMREALSRRLGIEPRSLGFAVCRTQGPLAHPIWSIQIYDQASGGAGYSPRLFEDIPAILNEARDILECERQCERGCSSCILAPDLFNKQERLDRRVALDKLDSIIAMVAEPDAADLAFPDAKLSRSVADELVVRMASVDRLILPLRCEFDLAALSNEPFRTLFQQAERYGTPRALLMPRHLVTNSDEAFRRGVQKIAHRFELELLDGNVDLAANGAAPIAIASQAGQTVAWFSRDDAASIPSDRWGQGELHPIVKTDLFPFPDAPTLSSEMFDFSATPSSVVEVVGAGQGCPAAMFGRFFVDKHLRPMLEQVGMWLPGEMTSIEYSDKYLKAPLPMLCAFRTFAALRDDLSANTGPLSFRLRCDRAYNEREPHHIFHNWKDSAVQDDVAIQLSSALGLDITIADEQADHARHLVLSFKDARKISLYLDQGFGQWRVTGNSRFNFHLSPQEQARGLIRFKPFIGCDSESYIAARAS